CRRRVDGHEPLLCPGLYSAVGRSPMDDHLLDRRRPRVDQGGASMADCKKVQHWFTTEVLVPVTRYVYEAAQKCEEVKKWVKEEVWDRVEDFISRQEEFCKDLP